MHVPFGHHVPRFGRLILILSVLLLLIAPGLASAGAPAHSVRGHAIVSHITPELMNQLSINASVDENGIVNGGMAVWPAVNNDPPVLPPPTFVGMVWKLSIDRLQVTGNVGTVDATVIYDNRFGDSYLGCKIQFVITDNGDGKSGTPDTLQFTAEPPSCVPDYYTEILGGNFIVK